MEYLIYPTILFLCFFLLYVLSRNDFVLLRQNIAASQIFDTLFMSLVASFLFGRAFYMVNNFKTDLIGFFSFFHIVKYEGLSMFGIFFGGALCFYLVFMKKKGIGRISDIYAISFLPFYAISLFFENFGSFFLLPFLTAIVSVFMFIFFLHSHYKYVLRDGSISFLTAIFICVTTFISQYFGSHKDIVLNFSFLAIFSSLIILPLIILLVINQRKKAT